MGTWGRDRIWWGGSHTGTCPEEQKRHPVKQKNRASAQISGHGWSLNSNDEARKWEVIKTVPSGRDNPCWAPSKRWIRFRKMVRFFTRKQHWRNLRALPGRLAGNVDLADEIRPQKLRQDPRIHFVYLDLSVGYDAGLPRIG